MTQRTGETQGFSSSKLSVLRKHPYFADLEAEAFDQLCREMLAARGGSFQSGELAIRADGGNAVPTSLFTRWIASP